MNDVDLFKVMLGMLISRLLKDMTEEQLMVEVQMCFDALRLAENAPVETANMVSAMNDFVSKVTPQ